MPPKQLEDIARTLDIFYPHAARARRRMIESQGRFVHYTTAANALNIIRSKRVWMRNTTCMADYREVQHGCDALNRYFNDAAHKEAFSAAVNEYGGQTLPTKHLRYLISGGRALNYRPTSHQFLSTTKRKTCTAGSQCGVCLKELNRPRTRVLRSSPPPSSVLGRNRPWRVPPV